MGGLSLSAFLSTCVVIKECISMIMQGTNEHVNTVIPVVYSISDTVACGVN